MVEVSEVLAKMKPLLGMDADEEFANPDQAIASANLAIKTSQVEDVDIIAILACYYYTRPRETDEEKENNIYWEMYQNAVNEYIKGKINPNDDNGLEEIEGAVFFD
jgi:hypothetical protein